MAIADEQLAPLARSVLSAQVKDRLLRGIIEGELAPGTRIIETRVARQLGTSQAPVREALRDLATLGLVEMQAFRGARVRVPAAEELIEAMEVRGELEAIAARQAARAIDSATVADMNALISVMRDCAKQGDAHGQALANSQFHTLDHQRVGQPHHSAPVGDTRTVRTHLSDGHGAGCRPALAGRAPRCDRRRAAIGQR